ncbi:PIG-L deacetylase family protein [Jatrophihabitans sp. YIM 134969]
MSAGPDSGGIVVPFPSTVVPSRPDLERPASLSPEISLERGWPARTALVVGATPHPSVLDVLQGHGIVACVASPAQVDSLLADVGPFTFLLLGADVFADDDGVDRVKAWHSCSPSARVKIVARPGDLAPAVLVRALRAGVNDVLDPDAPREAAARIAQGLRSAGAHRERVLAIGAHPDDVEIGCAGTLLDHRRRGDRITILTLSQGAVGGDTAARLDEARRTAEAIGAQLLFGDLPDTRVDEGIDTIRLIENVVAVVDPTVVYVHSAHDNHQDHRAVNTATRSATRGVRRVFAYQSPSATNEFFPTQFVPVDQVVERKVEVLQMFDSQNGRAYLEPELVTAGSRYWARHLGANARYAEPFEVVRSVGDLRHAVTTPVVLPAPVAPVAPVVAAPVAVSGATS